MAEVPEILNKFLKEIAVKQNFTNYKLKVTPISSGGANYTSNLYEITFTEGGKDIYMFAKVAAAGAILRATNPNIYRTEYFVYTNLSKIFRDLENQHRVPQEHRLSFSKFYGCNTNINEEIIVLENLVKNGYKSFDRFQIMSKEYAIAALRELAKFHALSFAYAEYYPEEYKRAVKDIKFDWGYNGGIMEQMFKTSYRTAIATLGDELKRPLQNYFDSMTMKTLEKYMLSTNHPVIGHADFRPNNLLHRERDDGTVDIKIVDLQTIQRISPIQDVINFIFTGSDDKFRAQYFDQLIDHYYTQLHAAMKRLHLDPEKIFSRADFDNEFKKKLPTGLMISIWLLPIVTVEEEDAPDINEGMDIAKVVDMKAGKLYKERLSGVVREYIKWGILY